MQTALALILFIGLIIFSSCADSETSMERATETAQPKPTAKEIQPSATPEPEPTKRQAFLPDVSYVPDGVKDQKLDLYLPETGDGPFPIILAFHGGAFRKGSGYPDKSMYSKYANYFTGLGYAFAMYLAIPSAASRVPTTMSTALS